MTLEELKEIERRNDETIRECQEKIIEARDRMKKIKEDFAAEYEATNYPGLRGKKVKITCNDDKTIVAWFDKVVISSYFNIMSIYLYKCKKDGSKSAVPVPEYRMPRVSDVIKIEEV